MKDLNWAFSVKLPCLFMLLCTLLCNPSYGQDKGPQQDASKDQRWEKAAHSLSKEAEIARQNALETQKMIEQERARLLVLKEKLKKRIEEKKKRLRKLQNRFSILQQKEQALRTRLSKHEDEIKSIQDSVLLFSKEAKSLCERSHITPQQPERTKVLSRLFVPGRFPALEDIKGLVELFFNEMYQSAMVKMYKGAFIGPDGQMVNGNILRAGEFTSYYSLDGKVGFLTLSSDGSQFVAVPEEPSFWIRRAISKYMKGEEEVLPLDLSQGALFQVICKNRGIWEWLRSGGPLVWPILIIGLFATALSIERIWFLSRMHATASNEIWKDLQGKLQSGRLESSVELCHRHKELLLLRMAETLLKAKNRSRKALESLLEDAILKEVPRLERFLPTLAVLAAISPMLGLLGTVTGMINTFKVITLFGSSDPRLMSGGISEALITTQLGLGVAIPIMLVHHFLERRVDRILDDLEEKGLTIVLELEETKEDSEGMEEL